MNCFLFVSSSSSSAAVFSKPSDLIVKSSLYGFCSSSWRRGSEHAAINFGLPLTTFCCRCLSTRRSGRASRKQKLDPGPTMEQEKDAFYVVRKGDVVGVYKSFSDCQAQVGSTVCNPPVSVYKGYSFPKDAVEYLVSHGLKNSVYSINAADLKVDLFGELVPCPFQQPASSEGKASNKGSSQKIFEGELSDAQPASSGAKASNKGSSQKISKELSNAFSCVLEFDGASKGNPGQAGAGAVLRAEDGKLIYRLREGLGIATCNVAEYRALLLGMRYALEKGFNQIHVKGDSKLVCMQLQGLWKTENKNMADLCNVAKTLKDKFLCFEIAHIRRDLNSEADSQANLAVALLDGQVEVECEKV